MDRGNCYRITRVSELKFVRYIPSVTQHRWEREKRKWGHFSGAKLAPVICTYWPRTLLYLLNWNILFNTLTWKLIPTQWGKSKGPLGTKWSVFRISAEKVLVSPAYTFFFVCITAGWPRRARQSPQKLTSAKKKKSAIIPIICYSISFLYEVVFSFRGVY